MKENNEWVVEEGI